MRKRARVARGRGATFLFLPNLPRERKREGCDRAVASAAISWDPPRYSSSIPTESCTVIDAWSSRLPVLLLLLFLLLSLLVRLLFVLLAIFFLFFVPFLPLFFSSSYRCYIFRTTKFLDLGLATTSTRYPDIQLIISELTELLSLLVCTPRFSIVDHGNIRRLVLPFHT